MNESVLNALIHLFALIATISRRINPSSGKTIVTSFLTPYLGTELLHEYLKVYDNYIDFYQRELEESKEKKQTGSSLVSFQVSNVCRQIKRGLLRNERMVVFLYLLEYVKEDSVPGPEESAFVKKVAEVFSISDSEFGAVYSFVLEPGMNQVDPGNLLFIDNRITDWPEDMAWFMSKKQSGRASLPGKHIFVENLYGEMVVLYLKSVDSFILKYTGQLNLFLENQKIYSGKSYFLKQGSSIRGPNIRPVYYSEIASFFLQKNVKHPVYFVAENVSYRFKNSENGLRPFSFSAGSGEMIGIMGGSGVGKSTLLNLFNGKLVPEKGKISINGYDIHRYEKKLEGIIGYVPQDDLLIEELSVFQNLYFNAKLCFKDLREDRINAIVHKTLRDLDLEETAGLKVGNPLNKYISGGQRKRLNISLELIREPSVLFTDEPTSGLSSMDAEKVMNLLKNQARKGKLVFVNIHQPSSATFKLFDRLIILDKGGFPVYTGNPVDAVSYFKKINSQVNAAESECPCCGNVNPEQVLQIIEAKNIDDYGRETQERKFSPEEWYQHYQEMEKSRPAPPSATEHSLPESLFSPPSLFSQFRVFFKRNVLSKLSDKQYLLINFLEAPLLAIILAFFTKYIGGDQYFFGENKNIPVFFFMSVVVSLFLGLSVSAEEIIRDRRMLSRESFLHLSRFSYLNAKILYLFGLSAIQTLIFVVPANLILGVQDMFLPFWLVLFTSSCFANILGLNISSAFDSVITIYILIPLIMVPQILFGGAMIPFDDLHPSIGSKKYVPFVGDLMTIRWCYEAMTVEQFRNNRFESEFFQTDKQISESNYYISFYLPRLEESLKTILWYRELDETDVVSSGKEMKVLQNELYKLKRFFPQQAFEHPEYVDPANFDDSLAEQLMDYIYTLKRSFQENYREANTVRNGIYDSLIRVYGKEGFDTFRLNNHNSALSDLLKNTRRTEKIVITTGGFVQKADPVFIRPSSDFGRTQMYASEKMINGHLIHTLTFNMLFVWFTISLLYFALYFDFLRKGINFLSNTGRNRSG